MVYCDEIRSCCGIGELVELEDEGVETLRSFYENYAFDYKLYVFTDGFPPRSKVPGRNFAQFLRRNKLGRVTGPVKAKGQHGYPVGIWTWKPAVGAVNRYVKRKGWHRGPYKYRESFYDDPW